MYKIFVIYFAPQNKEEFDSEYFQNHINLAKRIPNLFKLEINKVYDQSPKESNYYLIATLYFKTKEDLEYALKSKEMNEAAKHAWKISKGKMHVLYTEEMQN
jgi:conserved hypothetical protein